MQEERRARIRELLGSAVQDWEKHVASPPITLIVKVSVSGDFKKNRGCHQT